MRVTSLNSFKVNLPACEMWNFSRVLPLMIGSLVPETDEKWYVFLDILQILEKLCVKNTVESFRKFNTFTLC